MLHISGPTLQARSLVVTIFWERAEEGGVGGWEGGFWEGRMGGGSRAGVLGGAMGGGLERGF